MSDWYQLYRELDEFLDNWFENHNNNDNNNNNQKNKINLKQMEIIGHRFPDKNAKKLQILIKNYGWITCEAMKHNMEFIQKIVEYIKKELKKDKQEIEEMVCFFVLIFCCFGIFFFFFVYLKEK